MSWELEVHQLDVGQGDAAVVLFKKRNIITGIYETDKAILIDTGPEEAKDELIEQLENLLSPTNKKLDAILISHFHDDHDASINNLDDFVDCDSTHVFCPSLNCSVSNEKFNNIHKGREGIFGGGNNDSNSIKSIFDICKHWKKEYGMPDIKFIGVDQHIYGTPDRTAPKQFSKARTNKNMPSLISFIELEDVCYLTAGDLPYTGEDSLTKAILPLLHHKTLIRKNHHHGASLASPKTAKDNIQKTQPVAAINSHGKNNKFDHPREDNVKTYVDEFNIDVFYTNSIKQSLRNKIKNKKLIHISNNQEYKGHVVLSTTTTEAKKGSFRIDTSSSQGVRNSYYYCNTYKNIQEDLLIPGSPQWVKDIIIKSIRNTFNKELVDDMYSLLMNEENLKYTDLYTDQETHPHLSKLITKNPQDIDLSNLRTYNLWKFISGLYNGYKTGFFKDGVKDLIKTYLDEKNISASWLNSNSLKGYINNQLKPLKEKYRNIDTLFIHDFCEAIRDSFLSLEINNTPHHLIENYEMGLYTNDGVIIEEKKNMKAHDMDMDLMQQTIRGIENIPSPKDNVSDIEEPTQEINSTLEDSITDIKEPSNYEPEPEPLSTALNEKFSAETPGRQNPTSEYSNEFTTVDVMAEKMGGMPDILDDENNREVNDGVVIFQKEQLEKPTESQVQKLQKEADEQGLRADFINMQ